MNGIIYRAYDSEGKSYIGQTTKGLECRIKMHYAKLKDNSVFHNALLEKGLDAFKWEILESNIPEEQLLERERYWSNVYDSCKNGYNGKGIYCFPNCHKYSGENHPLYGKHFSEEHCKNISDSLKGNSYAKGNHWKMSEESRQKISQAKQGQHLSEEHKRKLGEVFKGKHWKLVEGKRVWY